MNRYKCIILILPFLLLTGCAVLFAKQEYVLIDKPISEKAVFHGMIYALPEIANVRKVIFQGEGKYSNFQIHVRDSKKRWKPYKKIPGAITFPHEVIVSAKTDAIKIIKPNTTGTGRIWSVEFYTIRDKPQENQNEE